MCGICGIINFDREEQVSRQQLQRMAAPMHHRGPDDDGYFIDGCVGLGFKRLSIIDLDTGHQPLCNEDGSVWIVFNGEIYNYADLRRDLRKRGHVFKTKSDTEVIVHLYEEYGERCPDYLRGMFAFAIYDRRRRRIFCARDRFGQKPFFYCWDERTFMFSSEMKSILQVDGRGEDICLTALDSYLTYGYIMGDQTIFSQIKKLLPAHSLTLNLDDSSEPKFSRYWDINFEPDQTRSERDWIDEIQAVLSESVKLRMRSDVPLGAFLSGGIDSSSVVALMSQFSEKPIKTFSIGFREQEYNELDYARDVARKFNTEHHEKIVEPDSIELLARIVEAYDEPFADSSAIPTYYVSQFTREHVTVALSGDGGDELFAGYDQYAKLRKLKQFNLLPDPVNKMMWGFLYDLIPLRVRGKGISYYLSQRKDTVAAYFSLWTLPEREKLYQPDVWQQVEKQHAELFKEAVIRDSESSDYISRMQELDLRTYLVDDILTKVDRASMMNSLEVRNPLLDHKFAELTFRIPSHFKLRDGVSKYIFKKAMAPQLPQSIIGHRKQGFELPLKVWFKEDLRDYIQDRLLSSNGHLQTYFDKRYIKKIISDHQNGMRDLNSKIWSLLVSDAWLEQQKAA